MLVIILLIGVLELAHGGRGGDVLHFYKMERERMALEVAERLSFRRIIPIVIKLSPPAAATARHQGAPPNAPPGVNN